MRVDLVLIGGDNSSLDWEVGDKLNADPTPRSIHDELEKTAMSSSVHAFLFWDTNLSLPDPSLIMKLLDSPFDVWHAGLKLGLAGQPALIDHVKPTWMLNRDPDLDIEASSWRLSLRACLIRTEVLRQLGGPLAGFDSLDAAGLEMGYRYVRNGVFIRHDPRLINGVISEKPVTIPAVDQMRFIAACFEKKWVYWSAMRTILSHHSNIPTTIRAVHIAKEQDKQKAGQPYEHPPATRECKPAASSVSVLIPTINRYPYLRTLLSQLRQQTIKPIEIIVVDQTPHDLRDTQMAAEFSDLPLRWFYLDQAGQCSSRNLGIHQAVGEFILFLDDDVEIPENLCERHLFNLSRFTCSVSSGTTREPDNEVLPECLNVPNTADVFPTNNTMIRAEILTHSGLFDLAYDHGQRADHDLGMRIYLSGEMMVLDPSISILHHHAPQGGLREHKARVVTRAASKKSIRVNVLTSVSDIYLALRYFSLFQTREMLWITVLSMFTMQGSILQKLLKTILHIITLPYTLLKLQSNFFKAKNMLNQYPKIPPYEPRL
ncbi:MAG: glycosyltransferase family 2 protein [Anaerolineaceae bacterium]|nr:glycosyltransferase family 2 protein [Anaerolineaceae bacterium]